jgi:hypothetical protein
MLAPPFVQAIRTSVPKTVVIVIVEISLTSEATKLSIKRTAPLLAQATRHSIAVERKDYNFTKLANPRLETRTFKVTPAHLSRS